MANIYVRSTDGSDADNGSTWALAKATINGAAGIDAAGDRIYVSTAHSESTGSNVTWNLAGTLASPVWVTCVNDAAEPPTAVGSTKASISTTSASSITAEGSAYFYGLSLSCGSGANTATLTQISSGGQRQEWEFCDFILNGSNSGSSIGVGGFSQANYGVRWKNCGIKFSNASQRIDVSSVEFRWDGGSILSSGSTPTAGLFQFPNRTGLAIVTGVDFSNASGIVFYAAGNNGGILKLRNCKLPASFTLSTGTFGQNGRVEMHNCDSGDTNYAIQVQDYYGSIIQETTIVKSGGASDGTTAISWKMVSAANAEYPHQTLNSTEIVRWNDTTGSSISLTIDVVTDNVTLTDAECWLEVVYLGTSGYPLGTFVSDAKADVLASAANQTTSSATWTTTGLTTPVKQKLSVSFTPQEKGFIHAVVKLAKASVTVYVDPKLTVA